MKKLSLLLTTLFFTFITNAQLVIPTIGAPVVIDFTGFAGAGLQPGGGVGMLDSDNWSATGFSDGDSDFGETSLTGDFAKGVTGGLVISGGIYGVDIAGNQGLMVQPTADDFTPGSFILKLENTTGTTIGQIDISYTLYILNDAARSNSFNFSYSYDNISYVDVTALDYISPEAIDFTPYIENKSTTLVGLIIPDGSLFYVRWSGNDVGGSGSRDEFALDDISITPFEAAAIEVATFNVASILTNEGAGSVVGQIDITNSTDCQLDISINAASTADALDVPFTPFGLLLSPGDPDFYLFNIPINEDIIYEGDETFILDLSYVSGDCVVGLPNQLTVTIVDNETPPPPVYTVYDIADVTEVDGDGYAISAGELVDLTGIVYGVNLWDGGLQFTLIDNTGGINVFSFDNTFGYTVTEGDAINVQGVITQFNGLTEVEPDTLFFIDAGNTLKTPTPVSDLNESTESDLVEIQLTGGFIVDPAQWLGDGSSFNVDVNYAGEIFVIRIDNNTELSSVAFESIFTEGVIPNLNFFVTGLGTQFDNSAPYTSGYQLMPRYIDDFVVHYEVAINQIQNNSFEIYPNPTSDFLNIQGNEIIRATEVVNNLGQTELFLAGETNEQKIDIKELPAGIYFLKMSTENAVYSSQFIKQ